MTPNRVIDDLLFVGCVGCGCTDDHACVDGCSWVVPYALCSTCAEDLDAAVAAWIERVGTAVAQLRAIDRRLSPAEAEDLRDTLVAAFAAALDRTESSEKETHA